MDTNILGEKLIFWAISGAFTVCSGYIVLEIKKIKAVKEGVKSLLRDRMLHNCYHYCEKGFAPFYAVENMAKMYESYHALGGNGAITEIYHKFLKLPQVEKDEDKN